MKFFLVTCLAVAVSAANIPLHGEGKITGGEDALDGEFPWMVSLRSVGILGPSHFCGGSIIDKDWVLTDGRCCTAKEPLTMHIVAGGIKLDQIEGEEQHRNVDKIIEHPNYVDGAVNLGNDACLLKLKKSLEWTEFVQPIPLPAAGKETPAGTRCTVTGWGAMNNWDQSHYNPLHKITVPVISDEECKEAYSSAAGWQVQDSMICARVEGGKDTCGGDQGGPFVCEGSQELVGIVSWAGCASNGHPGVYTEVSYFVDWILETMATDALVKF